MLTIEQAPPKKSWVRNQGRTREKVRLGQLWREQSSTSLGPGTSIRLLKPPKLGRKKTFGARTRVCASTLDASVRPFWFTHPLLSSRRVHAVPGWPPAADAAAAVVVFAARGQKHKSPPFYVQIHPGTITSNFPPLVLALAGDIFENWSASRTALRVFKWYFSLGHITPPPRWARRWCTAWPLVCQECRSKPQQSQNMLDSPLPPPFEFQISSYVKATFKGLLNDKSTTHLLEKMTKFVEDRS